MAKTNPRVVAITGSEDLLRRRALAKAIRAQEHSGWRVDYVDGSDRVALGAALNPDGLFMGGQALLVVRNPDKSDPGMLRDHRDSGSDELVVLLDYEGDPTGSSKFGKFVAELGKNHMTYPKPPKAWDARKTAIAFCRDEARSNGHSLTEGLAEAIVDRVGNDLGILAFEILKMSLLADCDGSAEMTKIHVAGGLAPLTDLSPFPIVVALMEQRNQAAVALHLDRFRKRVSRDPTLLVTSEIGKSVMQLIAVHGMLKQGASPDDISNRTRLHVWVVKNKTIPSAQRWPYSDLCNLARALAASDRAVLNGAVNSWVHMTARLLSVCGHH